MPSGDVLPERSLSFGFRPNDWLSCERGQIRLHTRTTCPGSRSGSRRRSDLYNRRFVTKRISLEGGKHRKNLVIDHNVTVLPSDEFLLREASAIVDLKAMSFSRSSGMATDRISTARIPALRPPPIATVATGTPAGI